MALARRLALLAAALVAAILMPRSGVAQNVFTETTQYSFCSQGGSNCTDGAGPSSGLIMDAAGNFYGTTGRGGANRNSSECAEGCGAVFRLAPTGSGWTETLLYSFCAQVAKNVCVDGYAPTGGLIMDAVGNLYGVGGGGNSNVASCNSTCGIVFKLAPSGNGWTETVLYSFCPAGGSCVDGAVPVAGLIMDGTGNFYGTTKVGGSSQHGVVFKLTPSGNGWTETVLYSFCSQTNCADGSFPNAGLIMDGAGSLYGTAAAGGSGGGGVVFRLTPSGTAGTETVLYSFCSQAVCADGLSPVAGLIMDKAGNLYGTTTAGGNEANGKTICNSSCGVVFQLAPSGNGWTETVLHGFCSVTNCADGQGPYAGLIMDRAGNLYGTTFFGLGGGEGGVVFQLTPSGGGWTETVLHTFGSGTDGSAAEAPLVIDRAGNLYGTTAGGGDGTFFNGGTAFRLTPQSYLLFQNSAANGNGAAGLSVTNGATAGAMTAVASPGTSWHAVGTADFDGDGMPDILAQNSNGLAAVALMNNNLTVKQVAAVGANPGSSWHVIAPGDFNGDGKADILWQNDNGQVMVWLMDGLAVTAQQVIGTAPSGWKAVGTGDFDGDGKDDILFQNGGQTAVVLMNGSSIKNEGLVGASLGSSWQAIAAGDFAGTGNSGIFWFNQSSGQVQIWTVNGFTVTGQATLPQTAPAGWTPIGASDFDHDGKAGLLWQNAGGQPAIVLMNGTAIKALNAVGPNPGAAWLLHDKN